MDVLDQKGYKFNEIQDVDSRTGKKIQSLNDLSQKLHEARNTIFSRLLKTILLQTGFPLDLEKQYIGKSAYVKFKY